MIPNRVSPVLTLHFAARCRSLVVPATATRLRDHSGFIIFEPCPRARDAETARGFSLNRRRKFADSVP
jgi:hypothetical protein